jgi:hypothetical protein
VEKQRYTYMVRVSKTGGGSRINEIVGVTLTITPKNHNRNDRDWYSIKMRIDIE